MMTREARSIYRRALRAAARLPAAPLRRATRRNFRDAFEFYARPAFEPRRPELMAAGVCVCVRVCVCACVRARG